MKKSPVFEATMKRATRAAPLDIEVSAHAVDVQTAISKPEVAIPD
jgi:hypothetical protein